MPYDEIIRVPYVIKKRIEALETAVAALPTSFPTLPSYTGRAATFTIAPVDATAREHSQADAVLTGTDDQVMINSALSGYKNVWLNSGTIYTTGSITPVSNSSLRGSGIGITKIKGTNIDVVYGNTVENVYLGDFTITSDTACGSGSGIKFVSGLQVTVERIRTKNQYWGAYQTGSTVMAYNRCRFWDNAYGGLAVDGAGVDLFLDDLLITQPTAANGTVGILINGMSGIYANKIVVGKHNYALQALPPTGSTVENGFFNNTILDYGGNYALYLDTAGGGTIRGLNFGQYWMASFPWGAYLKGTELCNFNEGLIISIGRSACYLDRGAEGTRIKDSDFVATGIDASNTYDTINVVAAVNDFNISDNTFRNSGWGYTSNPKRWIVVGTGASDYYRITGNTFINSAGTANLVDGGTGVNKLVADNLP